jgi:4-hydroxymandelate oxidase
MDLPVLLAPTAFHRLAHAEGELATARAAKQAGATMIAAMLSTVSLEEIAETGVSLWFQLYFQPDLEFTKSLVRRAEKVGCRAIVITVDSPALGRGHPEGRNELQALPPGITCPNLGGDARSVALSPEISWWHVDWLREITALPIVLKGVLHPTDARIALDHGVDGIIVSNHGGRQLGAAPATLDRLPAVVDAVEGAIPVLVDGGVRRGTDIAKAMALGAAAVAIGRPALWGLAVDGQEGVVKVLDLLRKELATALTLLGSESPGHLTRDQVEP